MSIENNISDDELSNWELVNADFDDVSLVAIMYSKTSYLIMFIIISVNCIS